MSTFFRLLGFLRPYRAGAVWSLVLAALAMVATVAIPWLTGRAIDRVEAGDEHDRPDGSRAVGAEEAEQAPEDAHATTGYGARFGYLRARMTDAIALRNRFAMVKGAWDDHLRGVPFPSLGEGSAEEKIERLELALVDEMRNRATPETAEQAADAMWGLVHARPDGDRVKQRVTELHEELARLGHRRI